GYLYLSAADGVTGWLLDGELYRINLGRVTSAPTFAGADALLVYPNPASDHFRVDLSAREVAGARLINAAGRTVRRYAGQQNQFSVRGLRPGLYFLQLEGGERLRTTKVVVR
ncbi:MAG: T9SS type A sorting domain-containing protein, partial [Catalinimonas sp.]